MLVADRVERARPGDNQRPRVVTFRHSRTDEFRNPAIQGTQEMIVIRLIEARLDELIREEYGDHHGVNFAYEFPVSEHIPPRVEILYGGVLLFDTLEWGPLRGHRMGLDVAQFVFNIA